jgi:hypothetical protein
MTDLTCALDCTSGCHADDCEHHGHLPAPNHTRAALQSLRERVEGPAMRVVKTLFAEVGDGDEEPTTIYAGNLDECIAAIRAAVLAEIDEALG